MTLLETEVREAEQLIRRAHPEALFIEIEPDASAGFVLPDPADDDFDFMDPPNREEWAHLFREDQHPPAEHLPPNKLAVEDDNGFLASSSSSSSSNNGRSSDDDNGKKKQS